MKLLRAILCASVALSSVPAGANVFKVKFRGGRVGGAVVAPVNSALPVITGIAREDDTGTCSSGTWSGSPSFTYARYRDGSTLIGGATAAAYTYVTADVGHTVECEVTATNAAGTVIARSLPTDVIAAASAVLASTQTIQFGERTRVGFGGHALGYAGTVYLGITGGTNGCDTKFAFNADKKLVPINGAGADASVAPTYTAAACDVTVAEYSGRTGSFPSYSYSSATGVTGTVTINIVPNAHSVQQRSTDLSEVSELRTVLYQCAAYSTCTATSGTVAADGRSVRLGDTVYLRDGDWYSTPSYKIKPAAYAARAGGPAAPSLYKDLVGQQYYGNASAAYNGAGFVTIRPDTDLGARFKRLNMGDAGSAMNWNLRFTRIIFGPYTQTQSTSGGSLEAANIYSSDGTNGVRMVQWDNNQFVGGTYNSEVLNTRNGNTGAYFKDGCPQCFFYDNTFTGLYTDINAASFRGGDVIGNTMTATGEDSLDGQWLDGARIWFNKWLARGHAASWTDGVTTDPSIHGDYIQNAQSTSARVGPVVVGNVLASGVAAGGQGVYLDDQTVTYLTGVVIKGNLYVDKYQNAIRCQNCDGAVIKWNTMLLWPGSQNNDTPPLISAPSAINMVYGYNLSAGTAVSDGSSIGLLDTAAEMLTYYDGPFTGAAPTTLSGLLSAFNPKAPASGLGGVGTGVDYTAQTASFPDGTSYVRPREAP